MRKKNLAVIFLVALIVAGVAGFFVLTRGRAQPVVLLDEKSAPEFLLKDYAGKEVRMPDFAGAPAMIIAWASWCAQLCREELREAAAIKRELGDGFSVIAVNRAEAPEIARASSDALGINNAITFLLDPADSFYNSIGGFSMPEAIFIGRDGRIKFHARGLAGAEEIRRRMQDLLAAQL